MRIRSIVVLVILGCCACRQPQPPSPVVYGDNAAAGHYLIEAKRHPSVAADIIAALVGHGIAVSELAEIPPDLERVFLDLTRRPVREAA